MRLNKKQCSVIWSAISLAPNIVAQTPKSLQALRITEPIQMNGTLNEPAWNLAPAASAFTQSWPDFGKPSSKQTDVKILYDDHFLYVGAKMRHVQSEASGPAEIVRQVHRRDQESNSDWFSVSVDSLHDHRSALEFMVNAAGVQRDGIRFSDTQSDTSWDGVWESSVSVDTDGWTAKLKIPLSILPIASGEGSQIWGINFQRTDQGRSPENSSWHVVPRGEDAFVSRFPNLTGIQGLPLQSRRDFLPYLSTQRKFETAQPFDDRKWQGRAGLDAHFGLSSHSQIDLSLRPDFGQVEVDEAVINLDTVETFFTEKRPFFAEGADIFAIEGTDLFYSRRIGASVSEPLLNSGEMLLALPRAADINAAAKYIAKYGRGLNLGLLGASVAPARARIRLSDGQEIDREVSPLTNFGVIRAQQTLNDRGNYLGGFASTVHQAGPLGRAAQVFAADGIFKSQDLRRTFEFTLSHSNAGIKGDPKKGWRMNFEASQKWQSGLNVSFEGANTGHDYNHNDAGFLGRPDAQRGGLFLNKVWDLSEGSFRSWEWSARYETGRDQAGHVRQRDLRTGVKTGLRNLWSLSARVGVNFAREDDRELRTFNDPVKKYLRRDDNPYASLGFETPKNRSWYLRVNANRAWNEGGPNQDLALFQNIKLHPSLDLSLETKLTRNAGELRWLDSLGSLPGPLPGQSEGTPVIGSRRLSQFEQTLRVAYAFTPKLTLQLFSQWLATNYAYRDLKRYVSDGVLAAGLPTDVTESPKTAFSERLWNLNLITRWEFRPGSTFFLVYTHGTNTDELINDRGSLSPRKDLSVLNHLPSDDTVALKISWLFR
jgi:Domain of unknown function (DUF5916)